MHILTFSTLFPNSIQPVHAVFIRNRMKNFVEKFGHQWTTVAPIPYCPKILINLSSKYREFSMVPEYENPWGHPLYHPRYFMTPKIGMRWYASLMYLSVKKTIQKVHQQNPIDVIDGHYLYPDGLAATYIAKDLNIPIILSARGTDLSLFPQFPPIRKKIKIALENASQIIGVCEELKSVACQLASIENKISVIGNGIDENIFKPVDKMESREKLQMPNNAQIWLCVGNLNPNKGFHLVIDAFSQLKHPDKKLVIIGDGPQKKSLMNQINQLNISNQVQLVGKIENHFLPTWYAAADYFVLASAREGWPNVLCEAQAMGLPIIATKVWGIPEIVNSSKLGILVQNRDVASLVIAMNSANSIIWDKTFIIKTGQSRTWNQVSLKLHTLFNDVVANFKSKKKRR